jgi:uncharacterized repeat protein (TIGR01451 family)
MCDHVWIFEAPGTADVYTIVVTNNGPSTVSSVTLTDTIPAALLNPSFGPSAGIYDLGTGVWSGAEPGDRPERDHDALWHDRSERNRLAHQHSHGGRAARGDRYQLSRNSWRP